MVSPKLVYVQLSIVKDAFSQVTLFCVVVSPLVETSGDPPLKATDSSASAAQDGGDKQYKKASL